MTLFFIGFQQFNSVDPALYIRLQQVNSLSLRYITYKLYGPALYYKPLPLLSYMHFICYLLCYLFINDHLFRSLFSYIIIYLPSLFYFIYLLTYLSVIYLFVFVY